MPHGVQTPLRVCYVVSYFHPFESGAERQALAQGCELARRGHIVHVVTRAIPGYPLRDEEHKGVFIHRWVETVSGGPLFAVSFLTGVVRALRRLRCEIDLVHTHQALWEAAATGLARPLLRGKRTLVQPASAGYYGEAEELGRTRGSARSSGRSWRTTVSSRSLPRSSASGWRSGSRRGEWCDWPAGSMLKPSARDRAWSRVNSFRVLAFCSPVVFILRRTFRYCSRHGPQSRGQRSGSLILVGPGVDRQRLIELAGSLGITDRVQFTGAVDNPAEYLRAADVFVLPSLAEGMSNSLLEAMATALPCAVSGIGGNTDLIQDGTTGRLVSSVTSQAWTQTLLELLDHPAVAHRLGAAARRRIDEEFSLGTVVDRYISLYRQLIAGTWPA